MVFCFSLARLLYHLAFLYNLRSDTYGVIAPVCLTNFPSSAAADTSVAVPKTPIAIGFGSMFYFIANVILGKWGSAEVESFLESPRDRTTCRGLDTITGA